MSIGHLPPFLIEPQDFDRLIQLMGLEEVPAILVSNLEDIGPLSIETLLMAIASSTHDSNDLHIRGEQYDHLSPAIQIFEGDFTSAMAIGLLGLVAARLPQVDKRVAKAREQLRLLLSDSILRSRWMAAIALGVLRDKKAVPVLCGMLTELLPPPQWLDNVQGQRDSIFTDSFISRVRNVTASLLWRWGDVSVVAPAFRKALIEALRTEREIPRPTPEDERMPVFQRETPETRSFGRQWIRKQTMFHYQSLQEPWLDYQEILLYGLGHRGVFGALTGVDIPVGVYGMYAAHLWRSYENSYDALVEDITTTPITRWVFQVQMVMGALGRSAFETSSDGIVSFLERPMLETSVRQKLVDSFGYDEQECTECLNCYEKMGKLFDVTNPEWIIADLWHVWD